MGASLSSRSSTNDSDLKKVSQNEGQTITALLLVISKNVSSMEKLVDQIGSLEEIEELQHSIGDIQNYIMKLINEAATAIQQLESLCNSESMSPNRQLQKRIRLQDEFTAAVKNFNSVQKLAADKVTNLTKKKKQDMRIESRIISALILIISEKVYLMKQIVNQLCSLCPEKNVDPEELLKELDQIDHFADLLINDASDYIKKQAESLIAARPIIPDDQLHQTILLEDELSTFQNIDLSLMSVKSLDTEKQNVMLKVNEFKTMLRRKKGKK